MKKFTKSVFSLILSLSLICGMFSCIPVSAATLTESNINFLDKNVTNDVTSGTVALDKKLEEVKAASAFANTGLRMTALSQNYLSATYDNSKNLVQSAKTILSDGTVTTVSTNYYKNGYIYDDSHTADKIDKELKGANFLNGHTYSGTNGGLDRINEGGYDLRLVFDLGDATTLDTLYLFSFVKKDMAITTYKVHISNSEKDLFTDESYVLYWDYYGGYAKKANSYLLNGNYTTGFKRSEGQVWTFDGNEKPRGQYIGIEITDAAYDDANSIDYFYLYEIGAYGTQIDYLEYADKDVTNDISEDVTEALDTKLALLEAESKVLGTKLRMTALNKDYVSNLTANSPNLVKSAKIKNYTDEAFSDVSSTVFGNVTDGAFPYGTGSALSISGENTYIGSSGKTGLFYDGSDETIGDVHGADRVTADVYDALLTLDLGESTEIYDFYMFNHVNVNTSIATYKVYVSDSEDDLYSAENEVLYWDYYNGVYNTETSKVRSATYLFNGLGSGYTELRRSEGQHWSFTNEKPIGRYVGIKVYEGSVIANNDFLTIYEIGVLSAPSINSYNLSFSHGEAVKVKADSTVTEGTDATFEILKADDVNVTSVTANGNEITAADGVYTIPSVDNHQQIVITTDTDSLYPDAEGMYNGVDLTKNSSFYDSPLWEGDTVYAETVSLYTGRNNISLAYPIDRVISVRSYDLQTSYVYGVDYTVDSEGKLVITDGSDIPVYNGEMLYYTLSDSGKASIDYDAVSYWKAEQYKYQIAVTYTHSEVWGDGALYETKPQGRISELTALYEKLKNGEEIDVVFYGDSTTLGWNASGLNQSTLSYSSGKTAPELSTTTAKMYSVFGLSEVPDWACDTWAVQVVKSLADRFDSQVNIINMAIASTTSTWGSTDANLEYLLDGTVVPDLFVVAYGGNDRSQSSETMNANISKIIDRAREIAPDCGVMVNSTFARGLHSTLTNNLASHEEGYYQLEEAYDDLIVAPVHSYTQDLIDVKTPLDYTANAYNHMNDFGQKVYASVLNAVLGEKSYKIEFTDKFDNVVYTAVLSERNPVLTAEQISAATAAVPDIYGYSYIGWDKDLESEFGGDTVVTVLYSRDTTTYQINFTDSDGNEFNSDVQFDQRFVLNDAEAGSFLVDGQVIGGAENVTLYGCGAIAITASKTAAPEEISVAILKAVPDTANDKNVYRVFAHIYNPTEEEPSAFGIIFAPGGAYTSDKAFTLEALSSGSYITSAVGEITYDLLASFMGITTSKQVTRVVRAYATTSGGNVYSNVYQHTFN